MVSTSVAKRELTIARRTLVQMPPEEFTKFLEGVFYTRYANAHRMQVIDDLVKDQYLPAIAKQSMADHSLLKVFGGPVRVPIFKIKKRRTK